MFENIYEVSISLAAGLILGVLISWLYWSRIVRKREDYIEDLETSLMKKVENLNKQAKVKKANLEKLNSELSQREEIIDDLNAKVQEKDDSIDDLKEKVENLEIQNRDGLTRAEAAETRLRELESHLTEKEQEVVTLSARSKAMQDDLSFLAGIGPKVSAVLRLAGITSFSRLASTDVNRIREVLEAENPNLLRLTDPSTWAEQARMAADGDWEALSTLQNDLKSARRAQLSKE
jgi:predicted flap endonuclease-1-like 5' DNA nuclease